MQIMMQIYVRSEYIEYTTAARWLACTKRRAALAATAVMAAEVLAWDPAAGRWGPRAATEPGRGERARVERRASSDYVSCVAPYKGAKTAARAVASGTAGAPTVPDSRTATEVRAYEQALDSGLKYFEAGRLFEAVEQFKRCAQLWPEHSTPPYNLACCYSVANQLDTATQYLWAAVERGTAMGELCDDPDLLLITSAKGFGDTLRAWERRLEGRAKAKRREEPARPWRETPARSRPSSASASSISRGRVAFNQPRIHRPSGSRSRSRSRERPQSAPPPRQLSPTIAPPAALRRHGASALTRDDRAQDESHSRRISIVSSLESGVSGPGIMQARSTARQTSWRFGAAPTLRPASVRRSFAAPVVLGDHLKASGLTVLPDYLSKGYSTSGFGGSDQVCIEVGNRWEPVPEIHARLACQCGAVGAKLFPTTVEEWNERFGMLTDSGALRMSSDQKAHKAADHGLHMLRDALAARRKMFGTTIRDLKAVFDSMDKDGSGALDHEEFAMAMRRLGLGLADEQIQDIISRLDQDGDGEIDYDEFAAELAARPLPDSSAHGDDRAQLPQRGGPPLPAGTLAKYQYATDTATLNTKSWTVVVRDASGASLSKYVSHVEFRLPEDSGFDETVVLCHEEPFELSRIGHSNLNVLITLHLWSGGGYCFEHELSFDPGQRTDGGGNRPGGRMRRVQFQPVEAPQQKAEVQAAKEHDAAEWWAEHEAEREKLANHPRFPNSTIGAADKDQAFSHSSVWTDGMHQANAAIRDRTNQLRSEHTQALSELKVLQERVGQQLTEEETQQRALAREQRKAEAAALREQLQRKEKKRKAEETQRAILAARTRADSGALSILQRTKHSDALSRRSKELMGQHKYPPPISSHFGSSADSAEYQAAHDLESRSAAVTELQRKDGDSHGYDPGNGTLASLMAAGAISAPRMTVEAVHDAAVEASDEEALPKVNAIAEADERLETEASNAPSWSEWKGLTRGAEIALASEALFQITGNLTNEDKAEGEPADVDFAAAAADTSPSSAVSGSVGVGEAAGSISKLDDALSSINQEIAATEQMHADAGTDAE